MNKEDQKKHIIDIMQEDQKNGLYQEGLTLDNLQETIDMFKVQYGVFPEIKIIKNAIMPDDTVILSPHLFQKVKEYLESLK